MSTLAQQVIATLHESKHVDELQEAIGQAADLLFKTIIPSHVSGYEDVDNATVTSAEGEEIKRALMYIVQTNTNIDLTSSAFFALGKSYDPALKIFYITQLTAHLHQLKQYNGSTYQLLIALDNIREDVFERDEQGSSSQGVLNVEKNVRQAQEYLLRNNILVPW